MRLLMERNGIAEAAYVGDTQGDLEAARLAGIPFVWAAYGFGKPEAWEVRIAPLLPADGVVLSVWMFDCEQRGTPQVLRRILLPSPVRIENRWL